MPISLSGKIVPYGDFDMVDAKYVEGGAANKLGDNCLNLGLTNGYLLVAANTPISGEFARFTATGLEGRTPDQVSAEIDHDLLIGYFSTEHISHTGVSIVAGVGLSGGGNILASRTLDLDINSLAVDGSPNSAADYVVTYDASAGTHKKVLLNVLPAGGGANVALSNLSSVAINTSLVSDTDNTDDLGTTAKKWKDLYLIGIFSDGTNSYSVAQGKTAYDHVGSDGSSHAYLDQSVTTISTPTFGGATITDTLNMQDEILFSANTLTLGVTAKKIQVKNLLDKTYAEDVSGDWIFSGNILIVQTQLSVDGILTVSGGIGGSSPIVMRDDVNPLTDDTFDLGSITNRWRDIHLAKNIHIGGSPANYRVDVKAGGELATQIFTGVGLDDGTIAGSFNGSLVSDTVIIVKIDGTGPDTFKWSDDNEATYEATGVIITGSSQTLNHGFTVIFAATSGHTVDDKWGRALTIYNPMWLKDAGDNSILLVDNAGNLALPGIGTFDEIDIESSANYVKLVSTELHIKGNVKITLDAPDFLLDVQDNSVTYDGSTFAVGGAISATSNILISNGNELRLNDVGNSHHVGFEAPALTASQIWVLPAQDGSSGGLLSTNGSGVLSWSDESLLRDGSRELIADWDAGEFDIDSKSFTVKDGSGTTIFFVDKDTMIFTDGVSVSPAVGNPYGLLLLFTYPA